MKQLSSMILAQSDTLLYVRFITHDHPNPVFVTVLDDPHTAVIGRLADFAASLQVRLLPSLPLMMISHSNDNDKAALQDQHPRRQTFQGLKEGCFI